ncbi:MAG TPA: helix-turn-helix domain-containing protein [Firmicutes bacterium]|nr:helix-turn-helix domain-containing protein [Bacillota bacterium]
MLDNLRNIMKIKNIKQKDFASLLGINEKTVSKKLNEEAEFTYLEFKKICKFFPEYNADYLFCSNKK